jgi:2-oxoglutarate ferredoxin oxidoreductase subunit beta
VNVKILLVNNQVYGLTKGQFSPTSPIGQVTKTSPKGVTNDPINPLALALSAGASFVARAVDKDPNYLAEIIKKAYEHQGCALIEIYQDCNIFNHGIFDDFALKAHRAERTILLQEGLPLRFGAEQEWCLELADDKLSRQEFSEEVVYQHNPQDFMAAMRLARLTFPESPVPLGIYYQQPRTCFNLYSKVEKTKDDLENLYRSRASWQQS